MVGVPKYHITLTEEERDILQRIVRKQTESQHIVRRAKIILRADEAKIGMHQDEIINS